MDEMLRQVAMNVIGMTEEDVAKISPGMEEGFKNVMANSGRYRMVAEVVSSKYCMAGLQPGQKYIVDTGGILSAAESTAPMCMSAIAPLADKVHAFFDRMAINAGVLSPISGFCCSDPGINLGGLGHVEFVVRVEEVV